MGKLEAKLRTQDQRSYQYETLLRYSERYRPEIYLRIIGDIDLYEFHHILWNLPFYKKVYKVGKKGLFSTTTTYIQLFDDSFYDVEIFKFKVLHHTQNKLKGSYSIEKEIVTSKDSNLFEKYVEVVMKDQPVSSEDIPEGIVLNVI